MKYYTVEKTGLKPISLLCPWNFPCKDTGVVCRFLPQGIFPTQGLNVGLLHCRKIPYHLSCQGSPSDWGMEEIQLL